MPTQALYTKWRPRRFEDVIGQEHIVKTLRNALIQNRIRHAYLFNGPRGTGKTTMARLLAKAINCTHPDLAERPCDECSHCLAVNEGRYMDLLELDAASYNSVDDVRDLRDKIQFSATEGLYKVYIIDEVHRFSPAAFDALLKTLEEPPEHAIFILATTELDKVPATIKSRSQVYEFHRVSLQQVTDRLQLIADVEGVQIDRDVLELVASFGTGSVRDSISLIDQLIVDVNDHITMEQASVVLGTAGTRYTGKIAQAIIENNAAAGLELLNQAIDEGADPPQFGRQMVEYLRNLLLAQTAGATLLDTTSEMKQTLMAQSGQIGRGALIRAIRAFNAAANEVRRGWQPQLPLELAIVESTRPLQEEVIIMRAASPSTTAGGVALPIVAAPPTTESGISSDTATSDVPEPDGLSLHQLTTVWPQILDLMRPHDKYKLLVMNLERAQIRAVVGKALTLTVATDSLKPSLQDKQEVIIRAIKRITNVTVTLKVVAVKEVQQRVNATLDEDPLVRGIMEDHSGQISSIEDSGGF